jgi:hypothetical protein
LEIFNNIFCLSKPDLTSGNPNSDSLKERPVMSVAAYDHYVTRFPHVRIRKGGGQGCPALLNYDQLRTDIKQRVFEKYGDVKQYSRRNRLQELIEPDHQASKYFSEFLFDDDTNIKHDRQVEYNANATILNAIGKYFTELKGRNKRLSKKTSGIWDLISDATNAIDSSRYPHTLPTHPLRLHDKYKHYMEHGYFHLIHKGNQNANAKKVNDAVERLVISLFCQQNLPFGSWVYDDYLQFLAGSLQIVDKATGLIYDREDFFDQKRGTYIIISRSTVWNIINNPANAMIINKFRNNRIDYETKMTPMNHRHSPLFSLSKITMDDRDLPRKTSDDKWVHTYMAFDVTSQVVLSCVYSLNKPDHEMIWNCFRQMYRNANEHGLMWPGEVEVENHLMKELTAELNAMFLHVTFCQPGSPQSKRAEHFIHFKKYHVEKRKQKGVGRFFQKGAYKTLKAGKGEMYEQEHIPLETLIAEDQAINMEYNHSLHPNQKLYPGKTRWQVLVENMNPDLGRPQKHKLFRYLGLRTETSIRNNDFATVMYEKYVIDTLGNISRLRPHNYSVEAYYVPDLDSNIGEVYLYQGETFITKATKSERYNEAKMERTDNDERIRTNQAKRKSHFFKVAGQGIQEKITRKLDISKPDPGLIENIVPEMLVVPEAKSVDFYQELEDDTRYFTSEEYLSKSRREF